MGIERDLHDLLYEHDCVIVPQWGGFLAQYRPARLDAARNVIHPPAKEVGFNRHLLRSDGLLADRAAMRDGISFAEAQDALLAHVEVWRAQLDKKGRLELPRIGIFYLDADRNLQFDPDGRTNFLKEAYGLRPIPAVALTKKHKEDAPVVPLVPVEQEVRTTAEPWKWAAAAGVAILLSTGIFLTFLNAGRQGGTLARLIQWIERPVATYAADPMPTLPATASAAVFTLPDGPLGVRTLPLSPNDSVSLTVDLGSPAAADTTRVAVDSKSLLKNRFHVIGGCFAQPENADRLLNELIANGYPALRLPRYGELHPVAFGSYADREAALKALAAARDQGTVQAWLLVR